MCLLRGTDWIFIYSSVYVFGVAVRTNSDYFPIQHSLTSLYNWDGLCLLRGTSRAIIAYVIQIKWLKDGIFSALDFVS